MDAICFVWRRPWRVLVMAGLVALAPTLVSMAGERGESSPQEKLSKLNYRHRTAHYALAGTVSNDSLDEFGRALEYIHAEYAGGFATLVDGRKSAGRRLRGKGPDKDRFKVIVLNTREEYGAFANEFVGAPMEHSTGAFVPSLDLLMILNQRDVNEVYGVLFHEAFHQFLNQHIPNPPCWLNEGVATYYGTARPTNSGLVFDRPDEYFWDLCRSMIRKRAALPLAEVVAATRDDFYDGRPLGFEMHDRPVARRDAMYAQAYTLIHLLLSDREGRQRLQSYVRDLAADDGSRKNRITQTYFDAAACHGLAEPWAEHVLGRAERP